MSQEVRLIRPPTDHQIIELFRYGDGQWIKDDGEADLAFYGKAIPPGSENWFPYVFGFEILSFDPEWGDYSRDDEHPNEVAYESAINACSKRYGCANGWRESDPLIESASYKVTVTMDVIVEFSLMPRETPLSEQDAISNAYGTVPDEVWEQLRGEGWNIRDKAERL